MEPCYGTTAYIGITNWGTVFKLSRDGSAYTVLQRDLNPSSALIEGTDGLLYGTTDASVFKLNRDGSAYTVLHLWTPGEVGYPPYSSLIEGRNGALYGTTMRTTGGGGSDDRGTVFKLNRDGSGFTVLRRFTGGTDGSSPQGGLTVGRDGALYGATVQGGELNQGTVFKLFSSPAQVAVTGISFERIGAQLSFAGGAAGQTYDVQTTTNLALTNDWQVIGSNTAAIDGRFQFLDNGTSNYPARYYRSVTP